MLLKHEDLPKALEILASDASVFVPGMAEDIKKFILWEPGRTLVLDGTNAILPPKDILFPQTEKMYRYKTGKRIEIKEIVSEQRQVIFGIRPCDMQSIDCMDKVFLNKGFVDSFYSRKRENTLLMALGCPEAERTCFCDSMGIDPNRAPNADVMMYLNDTGIVMEACTPKGEEAVGRLEPLLVKGGEVPAGKTECTLKVNMTPELSDKLSGMFEHAVWEETSRACIGCGTCTYVCPTCYCFDIGSENKGADGTKFRCWDSCMFSDYTRMAGGHNPRPTKKERVRNRYMHKLSYFRERYGQQLCVGCGRCVEKCPAHMDISLFIDKAGEVE